MAAISKRTQARNEKALQDLIKTVPGNDRCADCGSRNPGWASWSLGIFLCMRCASLHRKLGTHISKVKSLSMDTWSNEQVENMKRNGNTSTNRTYNPQNAKPPIPLDVDEVDAVLERFIRQKYDQQRFTSGSIRPAWKNDTGSTRSSEDQPPPLPPKPEKKFGFGLRSTSSTFPLQRNGHSSQPRSPKPANGWNEEPIRVNKQSRVFGATVGGDNDNLDSKLTQLRDLGFSDEKRNLNVLKGLGGSLEKTIESLVRLGEKSAPASRARTPVQPRNVVANQSMPSTVEAASSTNGISFANIVSVSPDGTSPTGQQIGQGTGLPQQQANMGSFNPANPYQPHTQSYNPFEASHDHRAKMTTMNETLSGVQISQQPLFPNATGGYPNHPPTLPDARLQTMTPPVPQMPHQPSHNPYNQQSQHVDSTPISFYQPAQQYIPSPSNPFANSTVQNTHSPYTSLQQSSARLSSGSGHLTSSQQTLAPRSPQGLYQQQPPQPSPLFQPQIPQQPQQSLFTPQNFFTNPVQYATQDQQEPQPSFNPAQAQTFQPQQMGRIDKASILALYNYPQLAPPRPSGDISSPGHHAADGSAESNPPPNTAPQRSVTMPVPSPLTSTNPFQSSMNMRDTISDQPNGVGRHMSQESVDIGGFQNGRHSPDTFAILSARFVR
ncbi:MAG: hypothetical protein Q9163_003009 [Psora crenata]